ncbi:MAG: DASS family sodium-coupled anion symporter [Pirellulaceae bacterium]|nr:DASS family sodium-coupled anion symporter [Pirellulaceae bacterium]
MSLPDGTEPASEPVSESPSLAARVGLIAGPALALVVYFLLPEGDGGLSHAARACGGVATLMAIWWMTEALPLEATALLPLVLLPLAGVYSADIQPGDLVQVKPLKTSGRVQTVAGETATVTFAAPSGSQRADFPLAQLGKDAPFKRAAAPFAEPSIFLFLGGFLIALAIEKWGLHRRIALLTVLAAGTRPSRLVGGFILATGLISMWISNTATTVMMLPIGMSVVHLLRGSLGNKGEGQPGPATDASNFATSLLLGIAYAASLGGFATLVGTPPNVFFRGFLDDKGVSIGFFRWMLFALPLSLVYLAAAWWLMTQVLLPVRATDIPGGRQLIRDEYRRLGPMSRGEWIVLGVFLATALLWIIREPLADWEWFAGRVPLVRAIDDSLIAMAGAIALFLIPVDLDKHEFALDWKTALRLPWGVLLLFGGGLSLATALTDTGFAAWIGKQATAFGGLPPIVQIVLIVAVIVFTGELTSNLAAVVAMLPILFAVAEEVQIDPLLLCVPAVVAASCGFMLPVATPPNAIVFGTGQIRLNQMVRAGLALDLLAIVLIPGALYLYGARVLGIKM